MTTSASRPEGGVDHVCEAADGWRLHVLDLPAAGAEPRACVLVGHAMMADRRTVWRSDRPSLAGVLRERGCRVLVPEQRGRGRSGPTPREGADWTYDTLVDDTEAYLELARTVAPGLPLYLVGHSLFGHTSLAWLGRHAERPAARAVDGVVTLAVALWGPQWEPSLWRRLKRRATVEAVGALSRAAGYVPTIRFGFGTADEAAGYWADFVRLNRRGEWRSRDGFDYAAGLARVTCPVLWVVSEGDRFAPPELSVRFGAALPRRRVLRVGASARSADVVLETPPNHMPLVTSPASRPVWVSVAAWIVERASHARGERAPRGPAEDLGEAGASPRPEASTSGPEEGP